MDNTSVSVSSQTVKFVESDISSYTCNSSDDESMIESDQQLFLNCIPDNKNSDSITSVVKYDGKCHHNKNNYPKEYVGIMKDIDEDDSSMADFLMEALLFNSEEDNMVFPLD